MVNPRGPQLNWQYSPPVQSPYYAAAAPPQPGRAPTPSAIVRWVATAVAVCLLLAGAVVVHRTVLSGFLGGAASPQQAVTQAIAAIEDGDLRRLSLMLPPDEVAGLSDVVEQVSRISSDMGEGNDLGGITSNNGVRVRVENLELKTHDEQTGLTKVSIENADITASFDPEKVAGPFKRYLDEEGVDARETTIKIRGAKVTTDGNTETVRVDGREQAPFVMTVQRDGSWYVSPFFTLFQYLSEQEGYQTSPVSPAPGFGSPLEAAEGFVSAAAETLNTRDITELARATAGVEGRLLSTYRRLFDRALADLDRDEFSIDVDDAKFRVLSVEGNTARIRPESLQLTATSDGETYDIDWDGRCLTVDDPNDHERFCLGDKTIGPYSPLVERLDYLVAVRAEGGWKISATRTVFALVADALSWIGEKEMPIIKALTRADPTELTKVAKVADTVGIGDTATVQVDAIGPYLDGGYVVVDIPNPRGDEFAVYCSADDGGCEVITIVTPSGDQEKYYRGGRGGERGDYKAIVVAPAGKVEIRVKSR